MEESEQLGLHSQLLSEGRKKGVCVFQGVFALVAMLFLTLLLEISTRLALFCF